MFKFFENTKDGIELVCWKMRVWKNFYSQAELALAPKNAIKIWNYKSWQFHIRYGSPDDFRDILYTLFSFYSDNPHAYRPPVYIYCDEAGIYFNSQEWANFNKDMKMMLPQVAKMNIFMKMILQDFSRLDINFRLLAYYMRIYSFMDGKEWKSLADAFFRRSTTYILDSLAPTPIWVEDSSKTLLAPRRYKQFFDAYTFLWPRDFDYDTREIIRNSTRNLADLSLLLKMLKESSPIK